jgi:hypothetical protein
MKHVNSMKNGWVLLHMYELFTRFLMRKKHPHPSTDMGGGVVQGCQICFVATYQNVKLYTKPLQNIPNGHKTHQVALQIPNSHKTYHFFSFPRPSKIYQNGDFGIQICHLATLVWRQGGGGNKNKKT